MMSSKRYSQILVQPRAAAGFTLVELMIALVLGLLVIAGVGSVFLANQNAYRSNVALGEVQEGARTSFEFLARELRAAGANPCGTGSVASVLKATGDPMLDNNTPIQGWDDATTVAVLPANGAGAPVAGGGDAIRLASARGAALTLEASTGPRANVKLQAPTTSISSEDILMLCDVNKATIFQVSDYNSSNVTVGHNAGMGSPGNQTKCLNHPVPQTPSGGSCNSFSPSSYLAIPTNYIWYVGQNGAGGRSLYRYGRGQGVTSEASEMVRGVSGMTIRYHEQGGNSFVTAGGVGNWENVDAVRLAITVQSGGTQPGAAAGTDNQPLQRVFTSTVALRNRLNIN
ncbi:MULTISPECIES: PilW family protein [unclassified Marinobacter]|uniref:PilW family protein n=1 Tax=unclassified Marinobacter TaxID=83889 RepID=UPI00273ACAAF|nr:MULTISPECIES: PilW family protein [unclassified Marinobacter]MDP4549011.1 PilW family protein [Marinobacter sp. MDS2]